MTDAGNTADRADKPRDRTRLPEYLTVKEVAELARCEHKAVRRAINAGLLQAFRPANKLLVREQDARAWVESRPLVVAPGPRAEARPALARRRRGRPTNGSVASLREIERQLTLDDA